MGTEQTAHGEAASAGEVAKKEGPVVAQTEAAQFEGTTRSDAKPPTVTLTPDQPSSTRGALDNKASRHNIVFPISSRISDTYTNFALLSTGVEMIDAAAEQVDRVITDIESEYLRGFGRLALVAAEARLCATGNLLSHEFGHIGIADELGLDGYLKEFGWNAGVASYHGVATPGERYQFLVGGLNQSAFNAVHLWKKSAAEGERNLGDAITYLVAKLDDSQYTANTWHAETQRDGAEPTWDPYQIKNYLTDLGQEVSYRHMLTKSLIADFLSPATWGALGQIGNYVASGERSKELDKWRIGNLEGYWPNVELIRNIKGDNFRINTMINPDSESPLSLQVDIRTDPADWDINAVGIRATAENLLQYRKVTFSPWLGAYTPVAESDTDRLAANMSPSEREHRLGKEFADPDEPGFELGTDFHVELSDRWSLDGAVGYGRFHSDGRLDSEWRANVGLSFKFGG